MGHACVPRRLCQGLPAQPVLGCATPGVQRSSKEARVERTFLVGRTAHRSTTRSSVHVHSTKVSLTK
eukprot:4489102-Alexandrium_andersonii.AAC.1